MLQGSLSEPASRALQLLVSLFGMFTVLNDLGDFLEDRFITGPMAAQLREEYYAVRAHANPWLCQCVMPHCWDLCIERPPDKFAQEPHRHSGTVTTGHVTSTGPFVGWRAARHGQAMYLQPQPVVH